MGSSALLLRRPGRVSVLGAAMVSLVPVLIALGDRPAAPAEQSGAAAAKRPIAFVPNRGQADARVRYYAQTPTFGAYFTKQGLTLDLHKGSNAAALQLRFPGARLTATRRASGTVSYFIGHRRYTGLPTYSEVRYRDVRPGIDVAFRSQGGRLKYEFLVAPGADPSQIRMSYAGADSVSIDRAGALVVATPVGPLRDPRPLTLQGGRPIASRYAVSGKSYGFTFGAYDRTRPLVIDPGLVWSTFLGGTGYDEGDSVATDPTGAAYIAGQSGSNDFPTTPGAYNATSVRRMFVSKFSPSGALVYSTYFGGTGDADPNFGGNFDYLNDIAVDATGHVYITGATNSTDFPSTPGVYKAEPTSHQIERFVTKLNPSGTGLDYSTVIGNLDTEYYVGSIAVDSAGSAYVAAYTTATNYPTTPGAYETTPPPSGFRSYLTKLNSTGTALDYSTLFHGSQAMSVAVDSSGSAYIGGAAGQTLATTAGAYDSSWNGDNDAFVTKFNPAGSALVYSTFVGGSDYDAANDITVDGAGSVYATGLTSSVFPTTVGAFSTGSQGYDVFVLKLSPSGGSLAYSTLLGGSGDESAFAISVDASGVAAVAGYTSSSDFPIASASTADSSFNGGNDGFLTALNPTGSGLVYSTYLGGNSTDRARGVAFDGLGNAYVGGLTSSSNFPTTPGAYDTTLNSEDAFLAKIGIPPADAYVRPKGATPMRVSLVTANVQCTDPTITHGSPLAYPSCAGPVLSSNYLTVGTGDSNARPALMQASLRMDVQPGNPATPADEADVTLRLTANDVFNKDLSDYTGELRGLVNLRITDKDNSAPAGSGTTIDTPFGFTAGCTADPDPNIGSLCDVTTTVDAVTPGAVKEGQRAVWGLDKVRVFDGGPDGDADTAAGNTLFLTQGVFVP